MAIWKHDNYDLIKIIKFPVETPICSKCANEKTPKISMNLFEHSAMKTVNLPYLHLPDKECQGGGI